MDKNDFEKFLKKEPPDVPAMFRAAMLRAAMLQGGNVGSGPTELEKKKRELETAIANWESS